MAVARFAMRDIPRASAAAAILVLFSLPSLADTTEIMDRWYAALMKPDREALSSMLAPDARITLEDLDLTQTRQEFIASMDEWEDAARGATVEYELDSEVDGVTTMLVCYTFPNDQLLMREAFTFEGALIASSTQTTVAEDCSQIQ
jgi:hypothetical protein